MRPSNHRRVEQPNRKLMWHTALFVRVYKFADVALNGIDGAPSPDSMGYHILGSSGHPYLQTLPGHHHLKLHEDRWLVLIEPRW